MTHSRLVRLAALLLAAVALACLSTSSVLAEPAPLPDDGDDEVLAAAEAGNVTPDDLQGALNTLADAGIVVSAHDYLFPPPPPLAPVVARVQPVANSRVACIEAKESGGQNVWRDHTPPRPGADKPGGVLQYFASTFSAHAAEMGHPGWSRWNPAQAEAVAAHDLALNRRGQWTVSGC